MKSIAFVSSLLASIALAQEQFTGIGTTYGGNVHGGQCGFQKAWGAWNQQSNGLTAALNTDQWDDSLNCGRCAKVQHENNEPVIVQIVDRCPECKKGDLDFATEAYQAAIKKTPGREKITWSFVDCPDMFVQGNVGVVLKEGSNPDWVAFQPQNFRQGINKVEIKQSDGDWTKLTRDEKVLPGYYFQTANVKNKFSLRLTSVGGDVIETREFDSINDPMQTTRQFGGDSNNQITKQPVPSSTSVPSINTSAPVTTPPSTQTPAPSSTVPSTQTPTPATTVPFTNTPVPATTVPSTQTPVPASTAPKWTQMPGTVAPQTQTPIQGPTRTPTSTTPAPNNGPLPTMVPNKAPAVGKGGAWK